jgi:LDH2 family malate/lactate/ureidoglycolate dehydrogenase
MGNDHEVIAAARVQAVIVGVLGALGVPAADASGVAEVLVEADLTGVDSHGVHLLAMYATRLRSGQIIADATIDVVRDDGSTVVLDAGLGIGQIAGLAAADTLIERARTHGVATVSVREATHLGAIGVYSRRIADAGIICLCVQNGPTIVPPYGGVTPLFSTNPISYAFPTGRHPTIVYDIATTAVAGNRLLLAKKRGDATIPEGWACDEQGRPTTDTAAASVWNLQWFGGHKGYGLGLFVELLAGVLTGASYGRSEQGASKVHGRDRVSKGFTFIGLDPERFMGLAALRRRTDELIDDIVGSQRAQGVERIVVPGMFEAERRAERLANGIPLSSHLIDDIDALATELGVATLRLT